MHVYATHNRGWFIAAVEFTTGGNLCACIWGNLDESIKKQPPGGSVTFEKIGISVTERRKLTKSEQPIPIGTVTIGGRMIPPAARIGLMTGEFDFRGWRWYMHVR